MTGQKLLSACYAVAIAVTSVSVEGAERVAFMTSVSGTGDLGSWADSGPSTGLAAADAICQARAAAALLPNPNEYVAWLSDSSNDAYCRAHGLAGTVAGDCGGQPTLPTDAGPWVRTDGYPFAPKLVDALGGDGVIYAPPMLDEFGNPGPMSTYFTETESDGTYAGNTSAACVDWTGPTSLQVEIAESRGATTSWTSSATTSCDASLTLLCLQTGPGDPLPPHWRQGAIVFVTSVRDPGDLGAWPEAGMATGLDAGDAICQQLAADAGLGAPSSFTAWLSSSGNPAAPDRLSHNGTWTRLDGVPVASSVASLIDGELDAAINVTETGEYLSNWWAWTGTGADGTVQADSCVGWTDASTSSDGVHGSVYRATSYWTEYPITTTCSSRLRLYCFANEVSRLLFDGFESTDTAAWSAAVP